VVEDHLRIDVERAGVEWDVGDHAVERPSVEQIWFAIEQVTDHLVAPDPGIDGPRAGLRDARGGKQMCQRTGDRNASGTP
jgi:hypothetical protein